MKLGALLAPPPRHDTAPGGSVTGSIEERRRRAAHAAAAAERDFKLKLRPKEALHLLIQLQAMLAAGVPLLQALRCLIEHAQTQRSAQALRQIAASVESGHDLSEAVARLPRCFESYVVHLLAAGEQAGALEDALGRAIELLDKQIRITSKVRGALAYPGFLIVMTVVMTTGILVFLVPKFEKLLLSKPELLPWPTRLVLHSSHFLRESPLVAACAAGALLAGMAAALRSRKVRRMAFDALTNMPALGNFIHKAYLSRSVSTLAMTLESGVPILKALEHARQVSQLPRLQAAWESASAVVRDGRPMHTALAESDLPPALVQMIVAGEASGSLDQSLRRAGEFLDRETQAAMETFTGLLGPMTVLVAGALVGFVVVSLMMPILQMAKFVA